MKRFLLPLFLLGSVSLAIFAEGPFNGLVLDNAMNPIKGVKVFVKDENKYARTDKKGRFGLTDVAPDDTLTLVVSRKNRLRIPVDGKTGMKIVLVEEGRPQASQDDELVNMGYGYVKRRELTQPTNGVSGDRLRQTGQSNLIQALVGLVPGLTIDRSGGKTEVKIRGEHSFHLSNEPLYIVDGAQVSSLDFININDVDNVNVLKDGSQYGVRGGNGVIVVTTKTGALETK